MLYEIHIQQTRFYWGRGGEWTELTRIRKDCVGLLEKEGKEMKVSKENRKKIQRVRD
jgi:hypothetical protein